MEWLHLGDSVQKMKINFKLIFLLALLLCSVSTEIAFASKNAICDGFMGRADARPKQFEIESSASAHHNASELTATHDAAIQRGNFEQTRGSFEVMFRDMPYLFKRLKDLPDGALVMDGGCGKGVTIGSIIHPISTVGNASNPDEQRQFWPDIAAGLQHLKFLGVTATEAGEMRAPLSGPRHFLFAGKLFSQHAPSELIAAFHQKLDAYFDDIGIFAYTTTPDLDLETLFAIAKPGAPIFIRWQYNAFLYDSFFQLDDGSFIGFEAFIERYASSGYEIIPHDRSDNVIELRVREQEGRLNVRRVKLSAKIGHQPGVRYFQFADWPEGLQSKNDAILWEKTAPSNYFRFYAIDQRYLARRPINEQMVYLKDAENLFSAFTRKTIREKDPFAYGQLLALYLQTGDRRATQDFVDRNLLSLETGTPFDLLSKSLLDLFEGRQKTPALDELKRQDFLVRNDEDLITDAIRYKSPYPFTLKSFGHSVLSPDDLARSFLLTKDEYERPHLDLIKWGKLTEPRNTTEYINGRYESRAVPGYVSSYDSYFIESALAYLEVMRHNWRNLPEARTWLKNNVPSFNLPD